MIYWNENQQPLGCFIHCMGKMSAFKNEWYIYQGQGHIYLV